MKIKVDDIKISARIRQESTDVSDLKESISKVGLLNPIIVNEQNELLSGFRRLTACRELGFEKIEAIIVKTSDDELRKLDIEFHENIGRLNLSETDQHNYQQMRHDILFPSKRKGFFGLFKRLWEFISKLLSFGKKNDIY